MSSGGARGRAGPPPDPNALRRDRKGDGEWTDLPACGVDAPEWPLTEPTTREIVLWGRQWAKPQGNAWRTLHLADEVALYVRYLAEAEQPDAAASVRTLVKQHQEMLGLSTAGLARNRWRIAGDDLADRREERPARQSVRSQLRSIG